MHVFPVPYELIHNHHLATLIVPGTMHAFGDDPSSSVGHWFLDSLDSWRSLVHFCRISAPVIMNRYPHWYYDNTTGVSNEDATALADALDEEIISGRARSYQDRGLLENIGDEVCSNCGGSSIVQHRVPSTGRPWDDSETYPIMRDVQCIECAGAGRLEPKVGTRQFSVDHLQMFVKFLRTSGGFIFMEDAHLRCR
jgi:hypothetical protein